MNMPIITLSNGIKVANFSSPHVFNFTDGSVLPACEGARSKGLMLRQTEEEAPHPSGKWVDIKLSFQMSPEVEAALVAAHDSQADIILVPFPVLGAVRADSRFPRIRVIRSADRVKKTIHIDRFCV